MRKPTVMNKLASSAHGSDYCGQTSSASYRELERRLEALSPTPGSRLLDAGCGGGAFSVPLAERFSLFVEGVDLSKSCLEEAVCRAEERGVGARCRFVQGDFSEPASLGGAPRFDLVLSVGSLYWGVPPEKALRCWRAFCREGARLFVFVNLASLPLSEGELHAIGSTRFIPDSQMRRALAEEGWRLLAWEDQTASYERWLARWCSAMEELKGEMADEMGQEASERLAARFKTYSALAKRRAVRRIVFEAALC